LFALFILVHISEHHCLNFLFIRSIITIIYRGHRGRDRMVVGFTTTYAINAYDVVGSNLDQGEVYNIM
jgi:hypothetical protein